MPTASSTDALSVCSPSPRPQIHTVPTTVRARSLFHRPGVRTPSGRSVTAPDTRHDLHQTTRPLNPLVMTLWRNRRNDDVGGAFGDRHVLSADRPSGGSSWRAITRASADRPAAALSDRLPLLG